MTVGAGSQLTHAANFLADHQERRGILFVAGVFAVSRVLYALAGIRFYSWSETHLMHFISPDLLRTDLLRSVFSLHNQPPFFNLFMGTVLKLVPGSGDSAFHAVYLFLGLTLAVSLYLLMRRLGVSGGVSAALTALFIASPSCILFENALLYTFFVAVFLTLAALFLHRWLENGGARDGAAFFVLLGLVVLTRSFFHAAWYAACVVLAFLYRRSGWKRTVLLAGIPFLVVFALYAKNLALFGTFGSSTWMGMSLSKMTTFKLPEEERLAMVKRGELSELSLLPPFKAIWFYNRYVHIPRYVKTGIPVLDIEFYPDVGNNWNNLAYVSISRQYLKDALVVMRTHPLVYVRSLTESLRIFFFPASDWFHNYPQFDNLGIAPVEKLFNTLVHGQVFHPFGLIASYATYENYFRNPLNIGFLILAAWLVAVFWGGRTAVRALRGREADIPRAATVAFMVFTILFVTAVTSSLEIGENNRFRFNVDPYLFAVVGMAVTGAQSKVRRRMEAETRRKGRKSRCDTMKK